MGVLLSVTGSFVTSVARAAAVSTIAAVTLVAALWSASSALAAYSSATQGSYTATVSEAVELSGLVASPTYPNWYWTHSDGWRSSDSFAACSGLTDSALAECQQVQRTRIWALKIDPITRKVTESRSFSLSNPAWALDPVIAQNNDWEDIALSPPRDGGAANLVLGALGNAEQNRVYDANGRDITCSTRRLIELREPNLSDPDDATWTPWKIYDIKNPVGLGGVTSCNFESLMVSNDGAGTPTAYFVTKTQRKLFARSLEASTGRDPGTLPAAAGSGQPYEAAVRYLGAVKDAVGLQVTAADTNGNYASLLIRKTAKNPCQILTWPITSSGLGAALTGTSPAKSTVTCNNMAEGLTYVRDTVDPSVVTNDLTAISDTNGGSKFQYWYYPNS